jgi:hypothetical protein
VSLESEELAPVLYRTNYRVGPNFERRIRFALLTDYALGTPAVLRGYVFAFVFGLVCTAMLVVLGQPLMTIGIAGSLLVVVGLPLRLILSPVGRVNPLSPSATYECVFRAETFSVRHPGGRIEHYSYRELREPRSRVGIFFFTRYQREGTVRLPRQIFPSGRLSWLRANMQAAGPQDDVNATDQLDRG